MATQGPYRPGTQKHSLQGKPHPLHLPKIQREPQRPRSGTCTLQKQGQILTLRITSIILTLNAQTPHKNAIISSQDSMPPPEPSSPTIIGPEKCSIAETRDDDVKICSRTLVCFRTLIRVWMDKSLNEVCENTNNGMK